MSTCSHTDQIRDLAPPRRAAARNASSRATAGVHLRMCLSCGHVGCCDSSPNRHATAHNRTTGHPIVRSFEPGERWRYCYVDDALV